MEGYEDPYQDGTVANLDGTMSIGSSDVWCYLLYLCLALHCATERDLDKQGNAQVRQMYNIVVHPRPTS
jgi:hypothetical protein